MRAPNQIIPEVILLYIDNRVGLRLTLQNIFVFSILGNEAQQVFHYQSRRKVRSRSKMLFLSSEKLLDAHIRP